MSAQAFYLIIADCILVLHALYIAFVVIGLLLIVLGLILKWSWVRNMWFRLAHLITIGIVIAQAWLGVICPLTIWENQLRGKGGGETYTETFVQHWLHRLIFYDAPPWVFTLLYTIFGLVVVLVWALGPPRRRFTSKQAELKKQGNR
jgi:hypothetical protein